MFPRNQVITKQLSAAALPLCLSAPILRSTSSSINSVHIIGILNLYYPPLSTATM